MVGKTYRNNWMQLHVINQRKKVCCNTFSGPLPSWKIIVKPRSAVAATVEATVSMFPRMPPHFPTQIFIGIEICFSENKN
jgi:hypothetical protein